MLDVGDAIFIRVPRFKPAGEGLYKLDGENSQTVTIMESEKYRNAYIIAYLAKTKEGMSVRCIATVFPTLTYLPAYSPRPELYAASAHVYWKQHIWPAPQGRPLGRPAHGPMSSERAYSQDKIDHVWDDLYPYMTSDLIMNPVSDDEYELHKMWWPTT